MNIRLKKISIVCLVIILFTVAIIFMYLKQKDTHELNLAVVSFRITHGFTEETVEDYRSIIKQIKKDGYVESYEDSRWIVSGCIPPGDHILQPTFEEDVLKLAKYNNELMLSNDDFKKFSKVFKGFSNLFDISYGKAMDMVIFLMDETNINIYMLEAILNETYSDIRNKDITQEEYTNVFIEIINKR